MLHTVITTGTEGCDRIVEDKEMSVLKGDAILIILFS